MTSETQETLSIARLLELPPLDEATLAGGSGGLDATVRRVAVCDAANSIDTAGPGDLVVLSPRAFTMGSLEVDLLLRKARNRRCAGVVVSARGDRHPTATVDLADKLKLPLILVTTDDMGQVAHQISSHVQEPGLARAEALSDFMAAVRSGAGSLPSILAALRRTVAGACSVTDATGALIAGDALDSEVASQLRLRGTAFGFAEVDGVRYATMPISQDHRGTTGVWLVVVPHAAEHAAESVTRSVLEVAAWALAAWYTNERLVSERKARLRTNLLVDLQTAAEPVSTHLLSQAALVGWRLDGWHAAVYLASITSTDQSAFLSLAGELEAELLSTGLDGVLVPMSDGWAFWATSSNEPSLADNQRIAAAWRRLVRTFDREHPELALCGGMGRPHTGPTGIGRSLGEAREACLLAVASNARGTVEQVDASGVQRLIVGWCTSDAFLKAVDTLFAPLVELDRSGDLLRTLEGYLSNGASTKITATKLEIHRNTVTYRLDRIREILPLDLTKPDDLLVAQLACRALRLRGAGPVAE